MIINLGNHSSIIDQQLIYSESIVSFDQIGLPESMGATINLLDSIAVDQFSKFINSNLSHLYLMQLRPGAMVPLHKNKVLSDITCYYYQVSSSNWGHTIFVNGKAIYNQQQGNIYSWKFQNNEFAANNVGWKDMRFLLGF